LYFFKKPKKRRKRKARRRRKRKAKKGTRKIWTVTLQMILTLLRLKKVVRKILPRQKQKRSLEFLELVEENLKATKEARSTAPLTA